MVEYWAIFAASTLAQGLWAAVMAFAWGRAGVLMLGSALFFGIGAYSTAISLHNGIMWGGGAAIGVLVAALVSWLIGSQLLGQEGGLIRFAASTLVLSLLADKLAIRAYSWTGGSNGILIYSNWLFGWGYNSKIISATLVYTFITGIICTIIVLLFSFFENSIYGRFLVYSRDTPDSVVRYGISIGYVRLAVATVSSGLAALAGALYAPVAGIVSPDIFSVSNSMQCLAWVAIGGMNPRGAFIAACLMRLLEVQLGTSFADWYLLGIALVLVGAVLHHARTPSSLAR